MMRCPTLLAVLLLPVSAAAQAGDATAQAGADAAHTPPLGTDSVTVVAGERYGASGFHRFFFGDGWRELWTTPIRVPVIDVERFAGGLELDEIGGGRQTKSVRFNAENGREYAFRSIDKDPSSILPERLREKGPARMVVQDQISASFPGGAAVVARLLEALDVPHPTPRLTVMPATDLLGKERLTFAGMLGAIEEYPDDGEKGAPGFGGYSVIEGSAEVLAELNKNPGDQIAVRDFLTARMVDLLVNDWDRHPDQWRWGRTERGDVHVWEPIPRDRDQAFVSFGGMLPGLARLAAPRLVSFGPDFPIRGLTFNSRFLDRRVLAPLERPVWDSIARFVQERLTDEVIAEAVGRMPREYQPIAGEPVAATLRARRDRLHEAATAFYEQLAAVVDIHATDAPDVAQVRRNDDGTVDVVLRDGRPGDKSVGTWFRRRFRPDETREVRIYLHGSDDRAAVHGAARRSVLVRIIGGKGDNRLVDSSRVGGDRAPTRFYDAGPGPHRISYGPADTLWDRRPWLLREGKPDSAAQAPPPDLGGQLSPSARLRYASDLGLIAGVGAASTTFGFRHVPFARRLSFWTDYASGPNELSASLAAESHGEAGAVTWQLLASASGRELIRYYGPGNETPRPANGILNQIEHSRYRFEPGVGFPLGGYGNLSVGVTGQLARTADSSGSGGIIATLDPYGADGDFFLLGAQARYFADTRDEPAAPTRGYRLELGGSLFPAIADVEATFGELHGEASTYLSIPLPAAPVLAVRAGAKHVWGRYPFFEAAFLGGHRTLRGWDEQRFAGDAAAWGSAELRLRLAPFTLILPGDFGIFGLADAGRVWVEGESSDTWHSAFGGGVWFDFFDPISTLSVAIADGRERTGVYVQAGFAF